MARRRARVSVVAAALLLLLSAPALPFASAQDDRPGVTVCTARYKGFDFFVNPADEPEEYPFEIDESETGPGGKLQGFDVDLRAVIFGPDHLNMRQTIRVYESLSDALYAVRMGECDLTHAPTTITSYRDSCTAECPHPSPGVPKNGSVTCCVDFSHQMLETGVAIMLHKNFGNAGSNTVVIDALLAPNSVQSLLGLFMLCVVAGHIFWLIERDPKDASSTIAYDYHQGSIDGVWWAMGGSRCCCTQRTYGSGHTRVSRHACDVPCCVRGPCLLCVTQCVAVGRS